MPPQHDPSQFDYNEKFIREEQDDSVFLALLLAFAVPIAGFILASKRMEQADIDGFTDKDARIARKISVVMFFVWLVPLSYITYKVIDGFDPPESPTIEGVNEQQVVDPDPVDIVVPANTDYLLGWDAVVGETGFRANDIFVRFIPDQAVFIDENLASSTLDTIADYAASYPDVKFAVTGFTNTTETSDVAQQLSLNRAQTIVDGLSARGVDQNRLNISGKGSFELYFGYASSEEANRSIAITLEELAPAEGR